MKVKTFISPSAHQQFDELVKEMLAVMPAEETGQQVLYTELVQQSRELDHIFSNYKHTFETLQQLIESYQQTQIAMRKKMRILQLQQKGSRFRSFTKKVKLANGLQSMVCLLSNVWLLDLMDMFDGFYEWIA
jgi:hypothetical protein